MFRHGGRGPPTRNSSRSSSRPRRSATSPPRRFPTDWFETYYQSIVPEGARIYNRRLNVRGMQLRVEDAAALRRIPMLIVSAEAI
jgi:hypothetical protein